MLIIRTSQEANVASESDHVGLGIYLRKIQLCLCFHCAIFLSECMKQLSGSGFLISSPITPSLGISLRGALSLSPALPEEGSSFLPPCFPALEDYASREVDEITGFTFRQK